MLFPKGHKLNSIIPIKCPQCHRGAFLEQPLKKIFKLTRVREGCSVCGLKYKIEPSFYYGSMYVAYAIGVAIMVAVSIIYWLVSPSFSVRDCFFWVLGIICIFGPFINGYAKIVWANFFFNFKSEKS